MKVIFATPSIEGPQAPYIKALETSIPLITDAGWEEAYVHEVGSPYISHTRASMTRKALDAGADVIVYIDYDLSWEPDALLRLIEADGDVVAGTYRFKQDEEKYMGTLMGGIDHKPVVREDGLIRAEWVPAGFLKITRVGIRRIMRAYPELCYGDPENPSVDLFNHGAYNGTWYGEDYAFSRRFNDLGGEIWILPDINLNHHNYKTETEYAGNFHYFLRRQPGGDLCKT